MPTLSFGGGSHLVVVPVSPHRESPRLKDFIFASLQKSVIDGVKGPSKIKVTDINCVALVHQARHRFLGDQQIGETAPTG